MTMAEIAAADSASPFEHAQQTSKVDAADSTCRLLRLPYEIRQQIYHHIFIPAPALMIRASATITTDPGILMNDDPTKLWEPTSELSSKVDWSICLTNHQIHRETLPILLSHVHFHQKFDPTLHLPPFSSHQPDLSAHLPISVLNHLRSVTYHIPHVAHPSHSANQRPCRTPFPFRRTPALTRFAIRKPFKANIDMLYDPVALRRMTRAQYEVLGRKQRLEIWERTGLLAGRALLNSVGRFGCGGWISQLVCPEVYGVPECESEEAEEGESKRGNGSVSPNDLGVPVGCEIIVEPEIMLFAGQGWQPPHIETLLVEICVRSKEVLGRRFKEFLACQATDPDGGIVECISGL